MRILAFSDLHLSQKAANTLLTAAKDADLILGVGDFAQRREGLTEYVTQFADWGARAVFTAGNNESDAELREAVAGTGIQVLHGECIEVDGVTIAGIGAAVPPLPPLSWQSYDLTETEAADLLAPIAHADILISHSPPNGVADHHKELGALGSTAIHDAAIRLAPKYLLCGHVHDAWGETGQIGETHVMNLGPVPNWITLERA
ncbi:metallophosphoesterase family protein [Gelidibacter sp. F2691]|nr:metallophosphoesterase family protein [Gelidibacter sp. F2691]